MKNQGFSLLELIITLVILGTLVITVVPKLLTNERFDSYQYRDQTLSMLRTIQLRAMQNTNNSKTFLVCISANQIAPAVNDDCNFLDLTEDFLVVAIPISGTDTFVSTSNSNGLSFSELEFDNFGKPDQNCVANCKLDFGEADICMSNEGGIYACE